MPEQLPVFPSHSPPPLADVPVLAGSSGGGAGVGAVAAIHLHSFQRVCREGGLVQEVAAAQPRHRETWHGSARGVWTAETCRSQERTQCPWLPQPDLSSLTRAPSIVNDCVGCGVRVRSSPLPGTKLGQDLGRSWRQALDGHRQALPSGQQGQRSKLGTKWQSHLQGELAPGWRRTSPSGQAEDTRGPDGGKRGS